MPNLQHIQGNVLRVRLCGADEERDLDRVRLALDCNFVQKVEMHFLVGIFGQTSQGCLPCVFAN